MYQVRTLAQDHVLLPSCADTFIISLAVMCEYSLDVHRCSRLEAHDLRSLSFYKEELVGETKNYIHIRSQAERLPAIEIFRRLTQEVLDSARTIELMAEGDDELKSLWLQYVEARSFLRTPYPRYCRADGDSWEQKFIEFHINAKRYKLAELL